MKLSDLSNSAKLLPGSRCIAALDVPLMRAPPQWDRLGQEHPDLDKTHSADISRKRNLVIMGLTHREAELQRVNTWFNRHALFRRERQDDWAPYAKTYEKFTLFEKNAIIGFADCDSFVTAKMGYLQYNEPVWPGPLCFALCTIHRWGRKGEGHAVLLAMDERQTYVLDNRHDLVLPLDKVIVKWGSGLKMHSYRNSVTGRWNPLVRVKSTAEAGDD